VEGYGASYTVERWVESAGRREVWLGFYSASSKPGAGYRSLTSISAK
jgi:hypothetical protein